MKKITRTLALLLVIVMAAASFTACAGNTASSTAPAAPTSGSTAPASAAEPSEAPVEMETVLVWSDNAHEKDLRVAQIEEFNNGVGKELGINIEYTVYGANFSDTIQIAAKAGDSPHMFRADTKWMTDFVEAGFVIPLDGMPGADELLAKYDGLLAKQYNIFNNQVYALPYNLTTYKFVVNTDLFDAAGIEVPTAWTWADVREAAKKITEVSNGDAFGFGLSLNSLWSLSSYLTMPGGVNVGHYGYDHVARKFDFVAMEPMLSQIYGIVQDGSVFPGFEGLDADGIRAQFSEGKVGILGAASFDAAVYNEQFPAKCNWAVVPEPSFDAAGSPYKEFVQPTQLLVMGPKANELPEKAMKVYEFFYSDECAAQMYEQGLYVPMRTQAIDMAKSAPEAKGFSEFADVPDKYVMAPMPDTLITIEGPAYREVIVNYLAGTAGSDIVALLTDCDARYNKALEALTDEQLALFDLPEGTTVEKSK